jgi:hypothetical protein
LCKLVVLQLCITKDDYDKKLQQFKDHQYRINLEAEEHSKADHDYKLTLSRVFSISRRVGDIFNRSEAHEKRMLLNYLLQNPTVDGKTLGFTLRSPFNTVLELATCPSWLPEHHINIPLLFNRKYMQNMAQQLYLIRHMERSEVGVIGDNQETVY